MNDKEVEELVEEELRDEIEEEAEEDAMEDNMDIQRELQEIEPGLGPEPEEQHNTLQFLKDILVSPDRFKTAYLTWEELGKPTFSTRFWLNLANTCDKLFDMPLVAEYCKKKAMITTDTSLSREGFMVQTSVTQRKVKDSKRSSDLTKLLKGKSPS